VIRREAVQDQTIETIPAIQKAERKALDRGIKDPLINELVPAIYQWREFAAEGGLMSYGFRGIE
jgi:hypothetical protein